ncbi:hypothetical protein [Microbacterium sp. 2MCAF23]|uniref:hypothetical protein n=1 Tax=Microbacterium sp. 2MCAF23 TaxID=3232985 RepID=UPI003F991694
MMMNTTDPAGTPTLGAGREFEDAEKLRTLLIRLHEQGQWAWRHDPEVAALMRHAANRYAALARRHGLDRWEAAAAAFDAMRTGAVRRAENPWAVITRAVKVTCIAEERANGLLCSVHQARRPAYSVHHDAERFSDRENPLTDYHPSLRTPDSLDGDDADEGRDGENGRVRSAVADAVALFHLLGWPQEPAQAAIDYICARLTELPSRASGFESLRRDFQARVLLDLPPESWLTMLRLVLGNPDPTRAHTNAARGILYRLLTGEPLRALLADETLVSEVVVSAPQAGGRHGRP